MPWPVAVVLCLLLGALIGAWQGFWIAYVGIPSFIVTLAGMLVFRGATQYLLEGQSIAPFPRSFSQVSSGFLPEIGGSGALPLAHGDPRCRSSWSPPSWQQVRQRSDADAATDSTSRRWAGSSPSARRSSPRSPPSRCCSPAIAGCRSSASSWRSRSSSTHSSCAARSSAGRCTRSAATSAAARLSGVKHQAGHASWCSSTWVCSPRWPVCCSRRG